MREWWERGPGLLLAFFLAAGLTAAQSPADRGRLEIGVEQRIRGDAWNNSTDRNDAYPDNRQQVRVWTRFWVKSLLMKNVELNFGLAHENLFKAGSDYAFDEIYFDQAQLRFKKLFLSGLDLQVGRYNIMKGDSFLFREGTPGDGPRNEYFNAATIGYSYRKSRLELIGILNPSRDRFLPVVHDRYRLLQNWTEQALGAYYTDGNRPGTSADAYYFLKKEIRDVRSAATGSFQPDRHLHTAGGSWQQKLGPRWSARGEAARQWGAQHGGTRIASLGGYAYLERTFDHAWSPSVRVGAMALSGDDPASRGTNENWDPLFFPVARLEPALRLCPGQGKGGCLLDQPAHGRRGIRVPAIPANRVAADLVPYGRRAPAGRRFPLFRKRDPSRRPPANTLRHQFRTELRPEGSLRTSSAGGFLHRTIPGQWSAAPASLALLFPASALEPFRGPKHSGVGPAFRNSDPLLRCKYNREGGLVDLDAVADQNR